MFINKSAKRYLMKATSQKAFNGQLLRSHKFCRDNRACISKWKHFLFGVFKSVQAKQLRTDSTVYKINSFISPTW